MKVLRPFLLVEVIQEKTAILLEDGLRKNDRIIVLEVNDESKLKKGDELILKQQAQILKYVKDGKEYMFLDEIAVVAAI